MRQTVVLLLRAEQVQHATTRRRANSQTPRDGFQHLGHIAWRCDGAVLGDHRVIQTHRVQLAGETSVGDEVLEQVGGGIAAHFDHVSQRAVNADASPDLEIRVGIGGRDRGGDGQRLCWINLAVLDGRFG